MINRTRFLLSILLVFLLSNLLSAASPRPEAARNGMVVAAESNAAEVGVQVLKDGGNAVDAAVAVAAALNVTEGYSSGMGGGCFALVYWAEDEKVYAIDGRETAPAKGGRDMYVNKDGSVKEGQSTDGVTAIGTPGEAAALAMIHQRWGSRQWAELFAPAIALADTGFILSRTYAERLYYFKDRLAQYDAVKAVCFPAGDTLPYTYGDRLVQKDLAKTLDSLAINGASWFYNSKFTDDFVNYVKRNKGYLTKDDFKNYQAIEREPIHGDFRGYDIYSMPPPSSGGVHIVQMLKMLGPFNLRYWGANSAETIHILAEVMSRAFADRAYYLGDPDFVNVPVDGLLDSAYLSQQMRSMKPYQASDIAGPGTVPGYEGPQTTHFSIIDKDGNMVAITATVNTSFGSGVMLPGWGLYLNNQMDDFSVQPGIPNFYGLVGSEANAIAGGKRPLSSMTPTIVLKDGAPAGIFGSPGGPRIITTVLQVMLNVIEFGMDIQEAVDYPRVHHQWKPDVIFVEPEIPDDVLEKLIAKGHEIAPSGHWSSAQCIWIDEATGLITGGTDSRTEGEAAGY
jgi:gamma-glutamyltranspeptidase/glutathione hydrolase